MKKFDLTQWCDYVRGLRSTDEAAQMQQAMDDETSSAQRTVDMLRRVAEVIETDATQPVPEHAVRMAKAIGSLQRPEPEPSQDLVSRLLSFLPLEITFDSLLEPVAAGTRSLHAQDRQVSFQASGYFVDLRIEHDNDSTAVVGQVLRGDERSDHGPEPVSSLSVVSMHSGRVFQNTTTGEFGEFQAEGLPNARLKLCFLVDDDKCIEFNVS